jgi:hypothetical protein
LMALDRRTLTTVAATDVWPLLTYRVAPRSITPPPCLLARGGSMFRDSVGRWWCVYEYDCTSGSRTAGCCLVFESVDIMRRLRRFPADWRRLSATELEALSWQA